MRHVNPRRAELLRRLPMFRACTEKELAHVDRFVDDIEVEAGEILIQEGRLGEETFVIVR